MTRPTSLKHCNPRSLGLFSHRWFPLCCRQLLGDSCTCAGAYGPSAKDVPLLHWLRHNGVDEPLGMARGRPAWPEALENTRPPRSAR